MRTVIRPLLLIALIALSVLSASIGFLVQRRLTPTPANERVRVSVVALESTPEPTPSPEPTASPGPRVRVRTGGRSSETGPGVEEISSCPAGCTCESRPPQGMVIVCR